MSPPAPPTTTTANWSSMPGKATRRSLEAQRIDPVARPYARGRNPDIAPDERIKSIRCRIDLRGASPETIVRDAEQARTRNPNLTAARYVGVARGLKRRLLDAFSLEFPV